MDITKVELGEGGMTGRGSNLSIIVDKFKLIGIRPELKGVF